MTDNYLVVAKRWARGWELHIDGVGVTQVATLSKAETVAREYIAFALDLDNETSFAIDVVPQLDDALAKQVEAARAQVREAEIRQREAAAKQREVARQLGRSGLSGREIAVVMGLTPQRVSQLIGSSSAAGRFGSGAGRRETSGQGATKVSGVVGPRFRGRDSPTVRTGSTGKG